ncbi:HAD family hydrolase [Amycolatopsis pigmentata]|uniref:HAD family hydrolase n=1 Tax=Amycolatopsis pigmentata TaxID=450801 RepID=A0ABW5FXP9_9PSEU
MADGQGERRRSAQLERARKMVADGSCAVLSLDIFDTVLWRRTPRPADVFAILGERLRAAGRVPDWLSAAAFREMRIAAERAARERQEENELGTEVSLFDIWGRMVGSALDRDALAQVVEAEVETERDLTVVDLDVVEIVELARERGLPVVLVSDTYFTEDQLARLLDRPELESLSGARIFRSHQHGVSKADGLWKIVLDQLGRRPEQVLHVGDNEDADFAVPTELGIRAVHYARVDSRFEVVLEREHESLEPFGPLGARFDLAEGDFGLTSLRAKTLAAADPAAPSEVRAAYRFGAAVLGPVLTGFAEWVAWRARDSGNSTLWCPMREGTLLSKLINRAAAVRGWEVKARPVWLSRHVVSLASLDTGDSDQLRTFIRQRYRLTVSQLLSVLLLSPGEVPSLATRLDALLDNDRIVDQVGEALVETPHLRNRLAALVTRHREKLLAELRSSGMSADPEPALVDLGWGATIQLYLGRALKRAGLDVLPAGYYLSTDARATRVHLDGMRMEGYLAQAGHPHDVAATISRSPEVIEQSVNDLCGSLLGFTEDGSPILGPGAEIGTQRTQRLAVQDGILAFQDQWNAYVANAGGAWPELVTTPARERLADVLVSALRAPTAEEAGTFGSWTHDDNFGSAVSSRVVPEDLLRALPYLSPNDLTDLDMRDAFWPALLAASDPALAAAERALASGAVDPVVFEPSDEPALTRISVKSADGKWYKGPSKRVRINHNGLSFARLDFFSGGGDITDIALALPGRPALVRIDAIEVTAIPAGQGGSRTLRWDRPEDFAGLVHAACTWLGGTMIEFHVEESEIWLPIAGRLGAPASSGQVTVTFAMLPRSRSGLEETLPAGPRLLRVAGRIREEYRARGPAGLVASMARMARRQIRNGELIPRQPPTDEL